MSSEFPDLSTKTPQEAHDIWEDATDLDAPELRALRNDPFHEAYLETAEGNQGDDDPPIPGDPLDDALHLAETPRDDWGPDERAEADEALNWRDRHETQFSSTEGEDVLPDREPYVNPREVAAARWAFSFDNDGWPENLR
jgi:hypothetical protein